MYVEIYCLPFILVILIFPFRFVQIVPAVAELIVAQLMWLDYDNPTKPVHLYINSYGTQVSVNSHCSKISPRPL